MSIRFLTGAGKPRLMVEEAIPGGIISSSVVSNPGIIQTVSRHQLRSGQTVRISDHSAEANGTHVVTVIDAYIFTIPVALTVAATGGAFEALSEIYESTGTTTFDDTHCYETGAPSFSFVKVNGRIKSFRVNGSFTYATFGKVLGKDAGVITIDRWTNGTPTNGQKFLCDGWIVDLPRTKENPETFTPQYKKHVLYGGDEGDKIETKFLGYQYVCVLDYSQYAQTEMLIDLAPIIAAGPNDRIIIVPRADAPQFNYEVFLREAFTLSRHRDKGYKKVLFVFQAKYNVQGYAVREGLGYNCGYSCGLMGTSF